MNLHYPPCGQMPIEREEAFFFLSPSGPLLLCVTVTPPLFSCQIVPGHPLSLARFMSRISFAWTQEIRPHKKRVFRSHFGGRISRVKGSPPPFFTSRNKNLPPTPLPPTRNPSKKIPGFTLVCQRFFSRELFPPSPLSDTDHSPSPPFSLQFSLASPRLSFFVSSRILPRFSTIDYPFFCPYFHSLYTHSNNNLHI